MERIDGFEMELAAGRPLLEPCTGAAQNLKDREIPELLGDNPWITGWAKPPHPSRYNEKIDGRSASMLKLLLGDPNARRLKRYQPIVSDINLLEEEIVPLSNNELRGLTGEFRKKLEQVAGNAAKERALLDELLPQALTVVCEDGSICNYSLPESTQQSLDTLAKDRVNAWDDRQLPLLELRDCIAQVKAEYDAVVKLDEQQVREAKVETYYYDIRKQVFEYDEVMNNQRKAVYTERAGCSKAVNSRPK